MLILNEVSNPSNMAGQITSDKSGTNLAKKKIKNLLTSALRTMVKEH